MTIPYFSLQLAQEKLRETWTKAIRDVIESGIVINGNSVAKFEESWSKAIGTEFAVGVSNGLDGLVLSLISLGIGPGSNVAVPAHTFIATWNAIYEVGANAIGVEVNELGLLDTENLEITCKENKIDCVIPVHMHGQTCDMDSIRDLSKKYQFKILEDASQAHLASFNGKYAGSFGQVSVFSLYPTKNLGALGDAGIVCTNSKEISDRIKSLRNYGSTSENKYLHSELGKNNRLDEIQAAILNVNLPFLPEWNEHRRKLAKIYYEGLKEINQITIPHQFNAENVYHHFWVLSENRDLLKLRLINEGVITEVHYPLSAAMEYQKITNKKTTLFASADKISSKTLSLPISQWHSETMIYEVLKKIKNVSK